MAIKYKDIHTTSDGSPFITIHEWVSTLPEEQQKDYYAAEKRQHAFRQQKIDDGSLIIDENGNYIWKDSTAEQIGKENDPIWLSYNDRYIVEAKIVSKIEKTEV
jgi:hypothetical protein